MKREFDSYEYDIKVLGICPDCFSKLEKVEDEDNKYYCEECREFFEAAE